MPDLRPTQLFQAEPSLAKTWRLLEPGRGVCLWELSLFLVSSLSLTGCASLFSASHVQSFSLPAGTAETLPNCSFSWDAPLHRRSPFKEPLVLARSTVPVESTAPSGLHSLLFNILSHARSSGHWHSCLWGQKRKHCAFCF